MCDVKLYCLCSLQPPAGEGAVQPWTGPGWTQHGWRRVVSDTDTATHRCVLAHQALIEHTSSGGRKHTVDFLISSSFGVDRHGHHCGGGWWKRGVLILWKKTVPQDGCTTNRHRGQHLTQRAWSRGAPTLLTHADLMPLWERMCPFKAGRLRKSRLHTVQSNL